jgi:predicted ATPase
MLISRLILKNWRNFRDVDVLLQDRVFIIGPNASGKSNLLDVFRFLRDIVKPGGGLQKAVQDRGGVSKIRCLAARQHPDIEIEVHLSEASDKDPEWVYSIGIKQAVRGHRSPYLSYERVKRKGEALISRPDSADKKDQLRLTQTYLEQINANYEFRDISKYFEQISYLHIVPQLIRNPEAFVGPGIPGDPFGRSFLERVSRTPENIRRSRLRKIEEALRIAVPQLKELKDVKDDRGITHLEAIYEHWRAKGAKQREDQFSDGTLRLIGLLWSLMEGESLLLLEEPELSLNSGVVTKIPPLISRLQKIRSRQVILSTHSYDLLSDKGLDGKEVIMLRPSAEGTDVSLASSKREIRDLMEGGVSVADAILPRIVPKSIGQLDLFKI